VKRCSILLLSKGNVLVI